MARGTPPTTALVLLDHIIEGIYRDLSITVSLRSILILNFYIQLNIYYKTDTSSNCEIIWLRDKSYDSARNDEWCQIGIIYSYGVFKTSTGHQFIEVMLVLID